MKGCLRPLKDVLERMVLWWSFGWQVLPQLKAGSTTPFGWFSWSQKQIQTVASSFGSVDSFLQFSRLVYLLWIAMFLSIRMLFDSCTSLGLLRRGQRKGCIAQKSHWAQGLSTRIVWFWKPGAGAFLCLFWHVICVSSLKVGFFDTFGCAGWSMKIILDFRRVTTVLMINPSIVWLTNVRHFDPSILSRQDNCESSKSQAAAIAIHMAEAMAIAIAIVMAKATAKAMAIAIVMAVMAKATAKAMAIAIAMAVMAKAIAMDFNIVTPKAMWQLRQAGRFSVIPSDDTSGERQDGWTADYRLQQEHCEEKPFQRAVFFWRQSLLLSDLAQPLVAGPFQLPSQQQWSDLPEMSAEIWPSLQGGVQGALLWRSFETFFYVWDFWEEWSV